MAYKLVATWSAPKSEDQEEFEKYYIETHVPVAATVPGLKGLVLTRTGDAGPEGEDPAFYRVAELVFDSREDLVRAAASPEWDAMRADAGQVIEKYGVELAMGFGSQQEWPLG